jgi:hypothetical protein
VTSATRFREVNPFFGRSWWFNGACSCLFLENARGPVGVRVGGVDEVSMACFLIWFTVSCCRVVVVQLLGFYRIGFL